MALTYGFYNSVSGDRKYDADQMSAVFDGVINDGVFPTVGEMFAVKASTGLTVTVASGRAWFNRTWSYLDVAMPVTVGTAHPTLPRIDAVVLEVNKRDDTRANSIKIVAGTADSAPQKPTLSNSGDVYQHAIAYITVPAGATAISQGNIEYVVGKSGCPFVTSILETTDIDALFAQWDDQFNTWFENVQSQLEGDIATNLQKQIDDLKVSEETSESYGLGPDARPDNLFKLLSDSPFYVGDIRFSERSNIGSNWALCNGASFDASKFPDLAAVLPPVDPSNASFWEKTQVSILNNNSEKYRFGFRWKGKYYYVYVDYSSSAPYSVKLISFDTLGVEEEERAIYLPSGNQSVSVHDLQFLNGKIVVLCTYYDGSTTYPVFLTAFDPDGEWSSYKLNMTLPGYSGIRLTIGYSGGFYWLARPEANNNYVNFYYSSSLETQSWTPIKVNCQAYAGTAHLAFNDTVIGAIIEERTGITVVKIDPVSKAVVKKFQSDITRYYSLFAFSDPDGLCFGGAVGSSSASVRYFTIANDATSFSTSTSSVAEANEQDYYAFWKDDSYYYALYYTGKTSYLYKSTSYQVFKGEKSELNFDFLDINSSYYPVKQYALMYSDDALTAISFYADTSKKSGIGYITNKIPAVSLDGVYAFIKIKEA